MRGNVRGACKNVSLAALVIVVFEQSFSYILTLFDLALIFEQSFGTIYLTIFIFSLFIGQKERREKKKKRG